MQLASRMSANIARCLVPTALAALAFCSSAHAGVFDLIYTSRIDVTTYPLNTGFSNGNSIALVVNKRSTDITGLELQGATFQTSSSNPDVQFYSTLENSLLVTPIHPNEVVGTAPTLPMTALMLPGESVRDVYPVGLLWLLASYPSGYTGTATASITMTLAAEVVHYSVLVTFTRGSDFAILYPTAARVSSVPIPTATRSTTWGALKQLYR